MECPICESTMERGKVYGDTYSLKWLPYDKKLFWGIWAIGADKIDCRTFLSMGRPFIGGFKCMNCKKIFLDTE